MRDEIIAYLNPLLEIETIKDASCNGLQVQGADAVSAVGLAVDACMATYKKAVQKKCQMLLVHHGMIWTGLTSITKAVHAQVAYLIKQNLNLYAAHLPLDMHPVFGNNILLVNMLNATDIKPFGAYHGAMIGFEASLCAPMTIDELGGFYSKRLQGTYSKLAFGKKKIRSIAVVSGGGSDAMGEAIDKNIDCFITGESSHWNHHAALEGSLNVLYLGHYHSETLGVKALGRHLEKQFGIRSVFLDEPTLI